MKFGKEVTTKILDEHGSKERVTENIVNNKINPPIRKDYEIRRRVHSEEEEDSVYNSEFKEIKKDERKLDTAFRLERPQEGKRNGYYYAVMCYSELIY